MGLKVLPQTKPEYSVSSVHINAEIAVGAAKALRVYRAWLQDEIDTVCEKIGKLSDKREALELRLHEVGGVSSPLAQAVSEQLAIPFDEI